MGVFDISRFRDLCSLNNLSDRKRAGHKSFAQIKKQRVLLSEHIVRKNSYSKQARILFASCQSPFSRGAMGPFLQSPTPIHTACEAQVTVHPNL